MVMLQRERIWNFYQELKPFVRKLTWIYVEVELMDRFVGIKFQTKSAFDPIS